MPIPAGYTPAPSGFFYYTDGSGPYVINEVGAAVLVSRVPFAVDPVTGVGDLISAVGPGAQYRFTSPNLKIAIVGDSMSEGQQAQFPIAANIHYWNTNAVTADNFLVKTFATDTCSSGDAVVVQWDGVKNLTVAIAGDSAGAAVDVTGGGFFLLTSGTNGKTCLVTVRWRLRGGATSYSGTAAGSRTRGNIAVGSVFTPLLGAAKGFAHTVRNYGIGGDQASDIVNRVAQITAWKPDIVLFMIGVNSIGNSVSAVATVADYISAVTSLRSAGALVLASPPIPSGLYTAAQAQAHTYACTLLRNQLDSIAGVVRLDLDQPFYNPTGTSGTGFINTTLYSSDSLHPSCSAWESLLLVAGDRVKKAITAKIFHTTSGADAYDATLNPGGNLLGVKAGLSGTGGTLGASPVPTGTLPDSWTDANDGSAGSFTSVTYSRQARTDGGPGQWVRGVFATASGGASGRYVSGNISTAPTVGSRYRVGIAIRVLSASLVNRLDMNLAYGGGSAGSSFMLTNPVVNAMSSGSITDSGTLYFVSDEVTIPSGTTSAVFYLRVNCATGGSITLDFQEPFLIPVL